MRSITILSIISALLLAACDGDLNQECHNNGSCNHGLQCDGTYCRLTHATESLPIKRRCSFESECYCVTCAEQCSSRGMKVCNFSDTTVWGNKNPSVCECNTPGNDTPITK